MYDKQPVFCHLSDRWDVLRSVGFIVYGLWIVNVTFMCLFSVGDFYRNNLFRFVLKMWRVIENCESDKTKLWFKNCPCISNAQLTKSNCWRVQTARILICHAWGVCCENNIFIVADCVENFASFGCECVMAWTSSVFEQFRSRLIDYIGCRIKLILSCGPFMSSNEMVISALVITYRSKYMSDIELPWI